MRRTILILLTFFCTVLFLISPVQALEETEQEQYLSELADTAGKDELQNAVPESAEELLQEAGIHDLSIESMLTAPKEIIAMLWKELKRQAMQPVRTFGSVLAALVLCAFLDCIRESFVGGELKELFSGVTVLFLTISVLFPASDCIRDCIRDLNACSSFMAVFAPIYASVTTASGLPVTGNLYSLLVFSAAQIISALVSTYLVPLSGIYLALSIAGALSPQLQITPMLNTLKTSVCWILSFLLAGFVTLLTMQTTITSSMDALTLKTSKMLVSSFVPIVGGALSEAITTANGCLKILRSVFGVYGIAAAVCTFLPTLLRTGIWYITMNLSASIGEMLSVKAAPALLKAGASLMSILFAVQLLYLLLILVSTTILLLTGGGAA